MEGQAAAQMPKYRSHKEVWALKIKSVLPDEWGVGLSFEESGFAVRAFTNDQLSNRPKPEPGMYMVQYGDGYISFSPAEAFESGYTLVGAPGKRPTIAELESILNSEEDTPITINPDGSISAGGR